MGKFTHSLSSISSSKITVTRRRVSLISPNGVTDPGVSASASLPHVGLDGREPRHPQGLLEPAKISAFFGRRAAAPRTNLQRPGRCKNESGRGRRV
jgi:hypothetical protein